MKHKEIEIKYRIPSRIYQEMILDLRRPHSFAHERVGFLFTRSKKLLSGTLLILATKYVPVDDADYIHDETVGARINNTAIRKAMQQIYDFKLGGFHVHMHGHAGTPSPSFTDRKGLPGIVESFANISGAELNGYLILSNDSFYATIKSGSGTPYFSPDLFAVLGYPMQFEVSNQSAESSPIFQRQSFLGKKSTLHFNTLRIAVVGYGGGGSHIGLQLAHLGFMNVTIFDADHIEDSNLNRLVGGWFADVKKKLLKTQIARRVIKNVLPAARLNLINTRWQENAEYLQQADIVVGCVDTYAERQQLETECRRYLIPYIDIGMDVFEQPEKKFHMTGQVILSMPGDSCMSCFGFLTEEKLAKEAAKYGAVGGRPQVVWPNGLLASSAIGILVDLITGWSGLTNRNVYLEYDGNTGVLVEHVRMKFATRNCVHYPLNLTGPPIFKKL